MAGLSVGLFSGAAVSLSTTLADVVKNGAECLRVSFRLGVYVGEFSQKLEAPHPDGLPQSWAHVVTNMTEDSVRAELDTVNEELGNPDISKVFVSAADKSSVSISGPPTRIKAAFLQSSDLRYSKSLPLPVYDGLCHASHLYGQQDVDIVLDKEEALLPLSKPVIFPLISSRTGNPFSATTAGSLLSDIATELITGAIYLDRVTDGILQHVRGIPEAQSCRIYSFRTSIIFKGIVENIDSAFLDLTVARKDMVEWIHQDFGTRARSDPAKSKLAIVGMACRMPGGSNNLDEFWENLIQGRDACTTVPPDRFDLDTHYDPTGKTENAAQTPWGNFIDRPGYFDAAFFAMSPKEVSLHLVLSD